MRLSVLFILLTTLLPAQVTYDRLRAGELERGNWLTYSGDYSGHRFSPLTGMTAANASRIHAIWAYQSHNPGEVETSPIVVDGVMYITEPPSTVVALDVASGRPLWRWEQPMPADLKTIGFGRWNRGVAVLGDMVYVGTLDSKLVALDARSGALRWEVKVVDRNLGHCITGAPLAIRGKIIVGIAGGEAGIRGFIDAFDAKTGKRLWRFWTIPGPGEPGHQSWAGDSWQHGGAPTWLTGTYDPELNLIYWGIGNPGPDMNADGRSGDNLYSCSLVALNADTGKLRWYFQFTPHDTHDWDSTQIPVLAEVTVRGTNRKVVAMANRNAFYYLLDRASGEFLLGVPYARQTWAKGLDGQGRPIQIPGTNPTDQGVLVWPSLQGATNWFSPSYDGAAHRFYVSVREMSSYYFKSDAQYKPLRLFAGGGERVLDGDKAWGAVRALDANTGRAVWDFRLQSPPWSGVLATAGGLVFGGSNEGNFYALDASNGTPVWEFQTGGAIRANPVAFAYEGRQRVAIAAAGVIYVFGLE